MCTIKRCKPYSSLSKLLQRIDVIYMTIFVRKNHTQQSVLYQPSTAFTSNAAAETIHKLILISYVILQQNITRLIMIMSIWGMTRILKEYPFFWFFGERLSDALYLWYCKERNNYVLLATAVVSEKYLHVEGILKIIIPHYGYRWFSLPIIMISNMIKMRNFT